MGVEPTESQKKVFRAVFVVLAIILATASLLFFLGAIFGWLPEWKPQPK